MLARPLALLLLLVWPLAGATPVLRGREHGLLPDQGRDVTAALQHLLDEARRVPGDANGWFESGGVADILLKQNVFENCLIADSQFSEAVVVVYPEAKRREPGRFVHRNIRVEDNTFQVFDAPILYADNTSGLSFRNNRIQRTRAFTPWLADRPAIRLIHCEDVEICGNSAEGNLLSRDIRCEDMAPGALNLAPGDLFRRP
ncbi:hypothetical protein GETHLI_32250 [Geothrix limicola]|uniref:Right handed beta helix domain-containing protein n=1 Tax=Geothrix limicola TaxID=2927978 RepID=A0ABQ5QJ53_9BACT|nr:hypothetical protein [Geothrix limicola]GLH74723.1 hypothetical protein GETHLI_32250 [Geothrix limicola]